MLLSAVGDHCWLCIEVAGRGHEGPKAQDNPSTSDHQQESPPCTREKHAAATRQTLEQ